MIKVLYIGKDLNYFNSLKKRFLEVNQDMEFKALWTDDLDRFQSLALEVLKELPNIAFLDYSSHPQKVMTLARSLPRLFERGPNLIGLWNQLAKREWILESLTLGIPFTHFKSPEKSDIIQQAFFLYNDGKFESGTFAKADMMKKEVALKSSSLFRVGYVSQNYIHVEHDFLPPENEEFELSHHLLGLPITTFRCERRLDQNYYYEMAFSSDYSFVHIPKGEVVKAENFKGKGLDHKKAQYRESEQQAKIQKNKLEIAQYLEAHQNSNSPKRTRLLVIDSQCDILKQANQPLDSYPYSIRFYHQLGHKKDLMRRIRPGIVVYQCPKKDAGELDEIMDTIKKEEGLVPFVFVFQSSWTSEHLKGHYGYERIIAWKEPFEIKQMLTFAETYHMRLGRDKSHDKSTSYHDKEERYYLKKDSLESFVQYHFQIELTSLCETFASFKSREEFALWSQVCVHEPVSFVLTVIEKEKSSEGFSYKGVIHCIGEKDRASLRRAVNEMIYQEANYKEPEPEEKDKKEKGEN